MLKRIINKFSNKNENGALQIDRDLLLILDDLRDRQKELEYRVEKLENKIKT
jgi:hypothetical protein